ncbi:hypothetical protein Tco_1251975 [Tanacetum coccineum]
MIKACRAIEPSSSLTFEFPAELKPCQARARLGLIAALLGTKPQTDQAEHFEEINQNVVIRSNGQKRYFSTLMRVLSIFDREDLNAVYQLVMDRFQDETPEGLVIHMLVEKKYPLRKKVLVQMLELKLESEEDITMALELIRFIKKVLAELEPEDFDGDEEDF